MHVKNRDLFTINVYPSLTFAALRRNNCLYCCAGVFASGTQHKIQKFFRVQKLEELIALKQEHDYI